MIDSRALVATSAGWSLEDAMAPEEALPASGCLVLDDDPVGGLSVLAQPAGAEVAVTWGGVAAHVVPDSGRLAAGAAPVAPETALLLPAQAISAALGEVDTLGAVALEGEGILARLAAELVAAELLPISSPGPPLDLVIDLTGDPAGWQGLMERLRPEGTLLAFVPPGAAPAPRFDYYPQLHRRSIRAVFRRWHRLGVGAPLHSRGQLTTAIGTAVTSGGGIGVAVPGDDPRTVPAWLAWD